MAFSTAWYIALGSWWLVGIALFAYVPRLRDRGEPDEGTSGCLWVLGGYVVILVGGPLLGALLWAIGVDIT